MTTAILEPPAIERKPKQQNCVWHCVACNTCFHSVMAFDLHRVGEQGERRCASPDDVFKRDGSPKLTAWTVRGYCDHQKGCYENGSYIKHIYPSTVWQTATKEADDDDD